ncbi:MAG TPA: Rrf2 family transcriptional regulator [Bacteroidota bacterium]|nr:Rrf2 family transcriptional regulator [Bacteroidota bacterium]
MSLLFSRQCEYALQAVVLLALQKEGEPVSIRDLTGRLDIPYHFLAKILQDLSRKGLLVSVKGPGGGFSLGMPAGDITLFHIVEAIDGVDLTQKCVMGFAECSGKNPCAVHDSWSRIRDGIYSMLAGKNVAQLAVAMKKPGYVK